jgi:hypothetical protein
LSASVGTAMLIPLLCSGSKGYKGSKGMYMIHMCACVWICERWWSVHGFSTFLPALYCLLCPLLVGHVTVHIPCQYHVYESVVYESAVYESAVCESAVCESAVCESAVCGSAVCKSAVCECCVWDCGSEMWY